MLPKCHALAGMLLLSVSAHAHHSVSATFDNTTLIELEGVISDVSWRNPHVRFAIDVGDGNGSVTWDIETTSLSNLRRWDITPGFIEIGQQVRIAGFPARRQANAIYVQNMLLPSGEEALLGANVEPRWADETVRASAESLSGRGDGSRPDLGIFRTWSTPPLAPMLMPETVDPDFDLESYPLTETARAAVAAFDPETDSPIANCTSKGMPAIMEQPYPMEFVDRGDTILIRLEEYDVVRTIHVDAVPADATSKLGHSVGRWSGDTLHVTTTGIEWPHFDTVGIPLTTAAVVEETFVPSDDGSRLDYSITVTDPGTFLEPVTLEKYWVWRPGVEVRPYDCESRQ